MSVVLDASALLAYLQDEPGGDRVKAMLGQAVLSTVNWAEVVGKARDEEIDVEGLKEDLESLGLGFEPFSAAQAEVAGRLKEAHQDDSGSRSATGRVSRSDHDSGREPSTRRMRAWKRLDLEIEDRDDTLTSRVQPEAP